MKPALITLISLLNLSAYPQTATTNFIVEGKLDKITFGTIYLTLFNEGMPVKDSSMITKGKFKFKSNVQKPVYAVLSMKSNPEDVFVFYAEPSRVKISGKGDSLRNLNITGSKVNDDNKLLKQKLTHVTTWQKKHSEAIIQAGKDKNQNLLDSLDDVEILIMNEKRIVVGEFVRSHPNSLRSAMAIEENFGYYAEAEDVSPLYNLLSKDIKLTPTGIKVKKMLDTYKLVAIGMAAPDIAQADTTGKVVSLSTLKGKYVLVDFWASWCGPCRKENPNIVKAYERYHQKGLEIFGVSYDNEKGKQRWIKAINDDKLIWYHVSDLKGWQNATSESYHIKAIPSNLLLDKDGKIIAKNLFGKRLSAKLAELMP